MVIELTWLAWPWSDHPVTDPSGGSTNSWLHESNCIDYPSTIVTTIHRRTQAAIDAAIAANAAGADPQLAIPALAVGVPGNSWVTRK